MTGYNTYTDSDLLQMLAQNDEIAFAQIYERYWKILYNYAHNILRLEEPAQDAVQEVFVSLWERRKIAGIQSLEAYLRGAVRFQVLSAIRVQKVNRDFYRRLSDHLHNVFVEAPILFKELELLFRDIIGSLPPDQQEIFTLSREQGLNYAQIAQKLNISVKTVEKKISKSLHHIRLRSDGMVFLIAVSCCFL